MRTSASWVVSLNPVLSLLTSLVAVVAEPANAALPDAAVTERNEQYRVWQRTTKTMLDDGRVLDQKSSYVELGNGICYWDGQQWLDTQELIESFPDGAVARKGPHQVIFTANINASPAVDLLTSDGKRFRSQILGLAYTDAASGNNTLVGQIKDSLGVLLAPNQVLYSDAFTDVKADIRYTYTAGGLEQDVILRENPPSPADYGFNPDTTRLEIYTEFLDPPVPTKQVNVVRAQPDPALRQAMVEPDLLDESLDFGAMKSFQGHVFPLVDNPGGGLVEPMAPTGKSWETRDGRVFLIEKTDYSLIRPYLDSLPKSAAVKPQRKNPGMNAQVQKGRVQRQFPKAPMQAAATAKKPMRLAQARASSKGLILDYAFVNAATNLTFKGDTTYYVTNSVTLSGTTTIEGGAVIKYATNFASNRLLITGPIDCRSYPYRPAFFTAKDDNTVGETINGSTASPGTNRYAGRALDLNAANTTYDLHDLRFRYPDKAIYIDSSTAALNLIHTQIGYANQAINNGYASNSVRNVLVHDCVYGLVGTVNTTNRLEHVTFHRVDSFSYLGWGTTYLTNSLLICVTNGLSYTGSNVQTNLSDAGIFQTIGCGARYLAAQSVYRNAGTTNINPTLLADIKARTTYPPVVLSGDFLVDTTLRPQAMRDLDVPDLGYHYDCLDWCWTGRNLTNVSLTLTGGVAVAFYDSSAAIKLWTGSKVISRGLATSLNRLLPYFAVQEQPVLWGSARPGALLQLAQSAPSTAPEIDLRFTGIDLFQGVGIAQQDLLNTIFSLGRLCLMDCQLRGGYVNMVPQYNYAQQQLVAFTNNTFQWTYLNLRQGYLGDRTPVQVYLRNNLFCTNVVSLLNDTNTSTWTVHDNLFDSVTVATGTGSLTNSYNGYYHTATLPTPSTGNVTVSTNDYQVGPLGRFYYPTTGTSLNSLRDVGSRNATNACLYQYCTTTNQVKETNSVVDIGFHYVSLNSQLAAAQDFDGDGVFDYVEEANGNGSYDPAAGETDWQIYNSIYGIGSGPGLVTFTPLK